MTPETNEMRRTVFVIHPDHSVAVASRKMVHPPKSGSVQFSSEAEFCKLATQWPGSRLIEIWNKLPNLKRVGRFKDRATAAYRIWSALQDLSARDGESVPERPERETKTERVVTLLKNPAGASLAAIM